MYCRPIYKILSLLISEKLLYTYIIKIYHLTVSRPMFLDYLVKLENYNCCRFQRHVAHETSE